MGNSKQKIQKLSLEMVLTRFCCCRQYGAEVWRHVTMVAKLRKLWASFCAPECNHPQKSHTCQLFRFFCHNYRTTGLLRSRNVATMATWHRDLPIASQSNLRYIITWLVPTLLYCYHLTWGWWSCCQSGGSISWCVRGRNSCCDRSI